MKRPTTETEYDCNHTRSWMDSWRNQCLITEIICALVLAILLSAAIVIVDRKIDSDNEAREALRTQYYTVNIPLGSLSVSSNDTTTISGVGIAPFYYGRATQNSVEYYVAWIIDEDGGYYIDKFPCEKTKLYPYLAPDAQPYCEATYSGWDELLSYKMYIPEGSIATNYDLTLP